MSHDVVSYVISPEDSERVSNGVSLKVRDIEDDEVWRHCAFDDVSFHVHETGYFIIA